MAKVENMSNNNNFSLFQDIYDNQGRLILSKGTEIELSTERIGNLKRMGIYDAVMEQYNNQPEMSFDEFLENTIPNLGASPTLNANSFIALDELEMAEVKTVEQLRKQFSNVSDQSFRKANDIVNAIIFADSSYSWKRYSNLLFTYVEWLYSHSINTAIVSCIIAIGLGYSNPALMRLAMGAVFHDIGMTLLPKEILLKSSTLTDVEYKVIQNHSEMGYSMIKDIDIPEESKLIVLQHHEKLDGSGYPHGLLGEEITEPALITMIAEFFDTATTARSYKDADTVENVLAIMKNAPHIFPDHIVDVLEKLVS